MHTSQLWRRTFFDLKDLALRFVYAIYGIPPFLFTNLAGIARK